MDADILRTNLEEAGEIMVAVAEFEEPLELHLHDTEIADDHVTLELADGVLTFDIEEVSGFWKHYHSTEEYGL
ncbi:MAG: hypothetical protein ACOC42_01465 [Halobacteriota archaeon]